MTIRLSRGGFVGALGAVAILLSCKGETSKKATSGSAAETEAVRPVEPESGASAPKAPTLPARPELPTRATPNARFTAETRDSEWAPGAESEIRKRFADIRGAALQSAECRQSQCRLTIAGTEGEVGRTIADLESNRGLHGYAKSVLLTAPERKADGSLVLRAFAQFDR